MNHLFVTYEIALKLKELGFNEPCIAFFIENKEIYSLSNPTSNFSTITNENKLYNISTPLWQQAVDWLNEHPKLPLFKDHVIYDSNKELLEERILRAIKKIQSVN